MEERNTSRFSLFVGMIILIIIAGVIVYFGILFVDFMRTVKPEIWAAIIVASATVLVSVISILISKHFENRQEDRRALRDKKVKVYDDLISLFFRYANAARSGKQIEKIEHDIELFSEINKNLIYWGGDRVIKIFVTWRTASQEENTQEDGIKNLYLFEKVLYEIRRDFGHKNKKLSDGDLLKVFINDLQPPLSNSQVGTGE